VSFEHPNLYSKLTGLENLRFYVGLFSVPTEDPMKLLDMVGLQNAVHKNAKSYSKGMKQRLVFARSIINKPEILFLDEPLSGLDPSTAAVIKNIIKKKKDSGCTIFLTTHNMFVADELCDRVAFINEGKIAAMDEPKELKLVYGERSVKLEYRDNGQGTAEEILFLDRKEDTERFQGLLTQKEIRTVHSQKATLEQIFMKLTGRGLT